MSNGQCLLIYSDRAHEELVRVLSEAARESGYAVKDWRKHVLGRGGNKPQIQNLWEEISRSRRVLALLDDERGVNRNVLYECGFTHGVAFEKNLGPTRLVTVIGQATLDDLPFDLQSFSHITHRDGDLEGTQLALLHMYLRVQADEELAEQRVVLNDLMKAKVCPAISGTWKKTIHTAWKAARRAVENDDDEWLEALVEFTALVESINRVGFAIERSARHLRDPFEAESSDRLSREVLGLHRLLAQQPAPGSAVARAGIRAAAARVERLDSRLGWAIATSANPWHRAGRVAVGSLAAGLLWCFFADWVSQWVTVTERYQLPASSTIATGLLIPALAGGLARPLGLRRAFLFLFLILVGALVVNAQRLPFGAIADMTWPEWQPVIRSSALLLFLGLLVAQIRGPRSPFRLSVGYHAVRILAIAGLTFGVVVGLQLMLPGAVEVAPGSPLQWDEETWSSVGCRVSLTILIYLLARAFLKTPWLVPFVRVREHSGAQLA